MPGHKKVPPSQSGSISHGCPACNIAYGNEKFLRCLAFRLTIQRSRCRLVFRSCPKFNAQLSCSYYYCNVSFSFCSGAQVFILGTSCIGIPDFGRFASRQNISFTIFSPFIMEGGLAVGLVLSAGGTIIVLLSGVEIYDL